jgi:serine/threonine protein kinase
MAPPSHCPRCSHALIADARFCSYCGLPIVSAAADLNASGGETIDQRGAAHLADELAPGTLLGDGGRYLINGALGRGGFGQTYLATELRLRRQCVIKRMLADPGWSAAEQKMARDNFRREAQLLADLNTPGHPNIPEIYEYLEAETCLVMKYIQGKSLNETSMPGERILDSARDICSALVYMHSQDPPVLHRDIKPANIVLASDGWVWLIDFGLSKSTPMRTAALKQDATMMAGTLGYTPPEQWQHAAVPQSDVYALAATLHTLLTGYVPPFTMLDLPALIAGKLGEFPPVRQIKPDIDRRIELLIQRGMAFKVAARPTAREFLDEVKLVLRTKGGQKAEAVRHGRHIITPNGKAVATTEELAQWCARYWAEARDWLEGNLPDVIESGFLDAQLAKNVREARAARRNDANAALDYVIELLDPNGQRPWSLRISPDPIDFGSLALGAGPAAKQVSIKNTGQRYIALHLHGEDWLRLSESRSSPAETAVALLPGMEYRLTVYANVSSQRLGGQLKARLHVYPHNGPTRYHAAFVSLPRWKTLWIKSIRPRLRRRSILLRRRPAQALAALAILLMLAALYLWLFG